MIRKRYSSKISMFGFWDRNENEFLEHFYATEEKAELQLIQFLKDNEFYEKDELYVKETKYDGRWDRVRRK